MRTHINEQGLLIVLNHQLIYITNMHMYDDQTKVDKKYHAEITKWLDEYISSVYLEHGLMSGQ